MEIFIPFVEKDWSKTILDFLYCGQIRRFFGYLSGQYEKAINGTFWPSYKKVWLENLKYARNWNLSTVKEIRIAKLHFHDLFSLRDILRFFCQIPLQRHIPTVFENHRKSLISHCERSELRIHFELTEINQIW